MVGFQSTPTSVGCSLWICSSADRNCYRRATVMLGIDTLIANILVWTGFASWQRYCTALQYWASAKLCSVEQWVWSIFSRAAITLGISPHSSCCMSCNVW